jgi:SAM-dependent methyltransferase
MPTATPAKRKTKPKPTEPLKLDLGCGQNKQPGFTGVDIAPLDGVDVVCDLFAFPWPFEDDSVDEVFASHFIEHVPDHIAVMNELHRIMKPGAKVRFVHPYLWNDRCFQDPTHKQFISEARWPYFAKDWRDANNLDHYAITCDFGIENIAAIWVPPWDQRSTETQQFAMAHYKNVISDLIVDLVCRKP